MKLFTFLDYYRMKPELLPEGVEVLRGTTPAGGAYAVLLYSDETGKRVSKLQASSVDVVECTAEGKELFRTNMRRK